MSTHAYTGTVASPSAYRNTLLADRARADIFAICSATTSGVPTCTGCGATDVPLEINHLFKRTWVQRALCRYRRMLRCRREALNGEITLLCRACNLAYRPVTPHVYAADDPF